ncbi:MAG: right-handed parallel beta-helix repeat-containing protein [Verrucomicrobiota bacterium]
MKDYPLKIAVALSAPISLFATLAVDYSNVDPSGLSSVSSVHSITTGAVSISSLNAPDTSGSFNSPQATGTFFIQMRAIGNQTGVSTADPRGWDFFAGAGSAFDGGGDWGVVSTEDSGGNMSPPESILFEFDLSSLSLGAGETLLLVDMTTKDKNGNLELWQQNGPDSGELIADNLPGEQGNQVVKTLNVELEDGDALALVSIGSGQKGFIAMTLGIGGPASLTAEAGNAQVELEWAADTSGALDFYTIYRSTETPVTTADTIIGTSLTNSFSDTTALNDTTYYYAVHATSTGGQSSPLSFEVSATPEVPHIPIEIYVATTGNDTTGDGSIGNPYQTIQKAADLADVGDTVIIREGIYRERITPRRGGEDGVYITYTAYPGEEVRVRGSDVWEPTWLQSAGGAHYAIPDPDLFIDDNYVAGFYKNPFEQLIYDYPSGFLDYTCGMVFVDGVFFEEVTSLSAVEGEEGTWYFDNPTGQLYINLPTNDPSAHEVEITTRRRLLAPKVKGLRYIQVKDMIFEHCGNMPMPWRNQAYYDLVGGGRYYWAAVCSRSGGDWIFDRLIIQYTKSYGIALTRDATDHNTELETGTTGEIVAKNNILRNSILRYNGVTGVFLGGGKDASGDADPTPYGYSKIYNCEFYENDLTPGDYGNDAHIKILQSAENHVYDNYFADTRDVAVWVDWNCVGTTVRRNFVVNCDQGVYVEMNMIGNDEIVVENNIIINSRLQGIELNSCENVKVSNNLILGGEDRGIYILSEPDRAPGNVSLNKTIISHNIIQDFPNGTFFSEDYTQDNFPQNLTMIESIENNIWDADDASLIAEFQTYGLSNTDKAESLSYSYDASSRTLTLDLQNTLVASDSPVWSFLDQVDYLHESVSISMIPGPFRELGINEEKIQIWRDLVFPIVSHERHVSTDSNDDATWSSFTTISNLSDADYANGTQGNGVMITTIGDLDASSGGVSNLNDGAGTSTWSDSSTAVFWDPLSSVGRFQIDLNGEVRVTRVNTFTWYEGPGQNQFFDLYYSDAENAPAADALIADSDLEAQGWLRVGSAATDYDTTVAGQVAVSVLIPNSVLARHLLLVDRRVSSQSRWAEIDVVTSFDTPKILNERVLTATETTGADWAGFSTVPNLSVSDFGDAASTNGVSVTAIGSLKTSGATVEALLDGAGQPNWDDPATSVFWDDEGTTNRFLIDLNGLQEIEAFNSYAWHRKARQNQDYVLYASVDVIAPASDGPDSELESEGWVKLGEIKTDYDTPGDNSGAAQVGVSFQWENAISIRHLLVSDNREGGNQTFWAEFDVVKKEQPVFVNPILHLDGTLLASVSGNPVSSWADQSGNDNDATPAVGSVLYPSTTRSSSGLRGLDFGTTGNSLELFTADESEAWLNQQESGNGFCVLIALTLDEIISNQNDFFGNSGTTGSGFGIRIDSCGTLKSYLSGVTVSQDQTMVAGDTIVVGVNYNRAENRFELWDSKNRATTTANRTPVDFSKNASVTLGRITNSSRYLSGMIGEVKVFDTALTPVTFEAECSALADKWVENGVDEWWNELGMNIGLETEDFDQDGESNLLEYALGGDPMDPTSREMMTADYSNGNLSLKHLQHKLDSDLQYQLFVSDDLSENSWIPTAMTPSQMIDAADNYQEVTYEFEVESDQMFIKLKVSR